MPKRSGLDRQSCASSIRGYASRRWEPIFFVIVCLLLNFQVFFFVAGQIPALSATGGAVAGFVAFENFIARHLFYVAAPITYLPLIVLLASRGMPRWSRRFLDCVGIYIVFWMCTQQIGLNLLVFDQVTPRFTLIIQLLFFLPYSLLIWGWIYCRLDEL